jgi:hypothetical protein
VDDIVDIDDVDDVDDDVDVDVAPVNSAVGGEVGIAASFPAARDGDMANVEAIVAMKSVEQAFLPPERDCKNFVILTLDSA